MIDAHTVLKNKNKIAVSKATLFLIFDVYVKLKINVTDFGSWCNFV